VREVSRSTDISGVRTVVGVQYRPPAIGSFIGLAANNGHTQSLGVQFSAHMRSNRPADDQPRVGSLLHGCYMVATLTTSAWMPLRARYLGPLSGTTQAPRVRDHQDSLSFVL
jgi:hypothetical protein